MSNIKNYIQSLIRLIQLKRMQHQISKLEKGIASNEQKLQILQYRLNMIVVSAVRDKCAGTCSKSVYKFEDCSEVNAVAERN